MNKSPHLITKIKGVFYKREDNSQKTQYHFILPNVYHQNEVKHTVNVLTEFDKKVETFFNDDRKIDQIILTQHISQITIRKPIYCEKQICSGHIYTNFKCKSDEPLDLIVGLEYLIDAYCYSGQFVSNSHEIITYWIINIKQIRESN